MKICSRILPCPLENGTALFNAFWPSCKFHVLDINLEEPYARRKILTEKKYWSGKRLKAITGKKNSLYSPELDLYSQELNTFHKFPLPSEISSSPAQENINHIKKSLEK